MRLTPTEPSDLERDGFTKNDIFGYSEFGERLANLVSNIEEPLVITLDGQWGSGKSVFIKQWAGLIRNRGGNVVYFDAFRNDLHNDAFLALASEIYSLAKETLGKNNPSTKTFLDSAKEVGKALAPLVADIGARAATAGLLSHTDVEKGRKALIQAFENEKGKAISEKLRRVDEERESLEAFRKALEDVAKSITEKEQEAEQHPPLIFIVDELDRCRPPFALDVIERIKHLFSVENVCFVLVTNLSHLETAIQGAYGAKFNAHTYLEKFYQHKVMLPKPNDESQRNKYLDYLLGNLRIGFGDPSRSLPVWQEIRRLVNVHALTLRQMEHVLRNTVLASASVNENQFFVPQVVAGLCVMRQTHPDLYEHARENRLPWEEVKEFLQIDAGRNDTNTNEREKIGEWWQYFVDPNLPAKIIQDYSRPLMHYSMFFHGRYTLPEDRLVVLYIFTDLIDSLADDYSSK